jgi:hypothetical protein
MLRCHHFHVALVPLVSVMICCPAAGAARAKPVATITAAAAAAERTPIPFAWTAKRVPAGGKVVVQRQVGSAKAWRTVARLPAGGNGVGNLPALGLGEYQVRIAVQGKKKNGKRPILASRRIVLRVFGVVSFAMLFAKETPGTYTATGRTFSYAFPRTMFGSSQTAVTIAKDRNFCRAVHVDVVLGKGALGPASAHVGLLQETRDEAAVSLATDVISSLDAALTPGQSWSINNALTSGDAPLGVGIYYNGFANCYRADSVEGFA